MQICKSSYYESKVIPTEVRCWLVVPCECPLRNWLRPAFKQAYCPLHQAALKTKMAATRKVYWWGDAVMHCILPNEESVFTHPVINMQLVLLRENVCTISRFSYAWFVGESWAHLQSATLRTPTNQANDHCTDALWQNHARLTIGISMHFKCVMKCFGRGATSVRVADQYI